MTARSRFSYTLTSLFVLLTGVAIMCAVFRAQWSHMASEWHEETEALSTMRAGGRIEVTKRRITPPVLLRWSLRRQNGSEILDRIVTISADLDLASPPETERYERSAQFLALVKRCHNIEHLEMDLMYVTDSSVSSLAALTSLRELDLSYSRITNAGMKKLSGLRSLEYISLESVQGIGDSGLTGLDECRELREVSLAGTEVTDDGVALLQNHSKVSALNLCGTKVSGKCLKLGRFQHSLSWLNFDTGLVDDEAMDSIGYCSSLQSLTLSGPFSDYAMRNLGKLTSLVALEICGDYGDGGIQHLGPLKKLRFLRVVSRKGTLTDRTLEYLNGLTNLERLEVENYRMITDQGLRWLRGMPRLSHVLLTGSSVSRSEILKQLGDLSELSRPVVRGTS